MHATKRQTALAQDAERKRKRERRVRIGAEDRTYRSGTVRRRAMSAGHNADVVNIETCYENKKKADEQWKKNRKVPLPVSIIITSEQLKKMI